MSYAGYVFAAYGLAIIVVATACVKITLDYRQLRAQIAQQDSSRND